MIDPFLPLLLLIAFSMLGVLLGTITGLVPGFHPNNVAFILLAIAPMLLSKLQFVDAFGIYATNLNASADKGSCRRQFGLGSVRLLASV
jgi:TctA family transporter